MILVIEIPGRPPTPNARAGWQQTYRDRTHWRDVAAAYAGEARRAAGLKAPLERVSIDVLFVVPDRRRRDLDNLIASSKPLTDGLVAAGVLKDDSTEVIAKMTFLVDMQRGRTGTTYIIEGPA